MEGVHQRPVEGELLVVGNDTYDPCHYAHDCETRIVD